MLDQLLQYLRRNQQTQIAPVNSDGPRFHAEGRPKLDRPTLEFMDHQNLNNEFKQSHDKFWNQPEFQKMSPQERAKWELWVEQYLNTQREKRQSANKLWM